MKIIFFGLGSIGNRHAKILRDNFNYELFAYRSAKGVKNTQLNIKEVFTWAEVKKIKPDIAFITNPTYLHIKTAIQCARLGMDLFIEKPLGCGTSGLSELIDIVRRKRLTTYIAYCMRFHPIIKKLRSYLGDKKRFHSRVTASSYLPDWRPDRDYKDTYSSQRCKGGGVILDLSHEIDYSYYLFGGGVTLEGIFGKISNLEIDSEDYANILMRGERGAASLHLNFFSRNTERKIAIDCNDSSFIQADLINGSLVIGKKGKLRQFNYEVNLNQIYLEQLRYFFKNINNPRMMNNIIDASKLFSGIISFRNKNEE